ncbi:MAG: inositol 2-dehydrogenase [Gammaproteobacteria bacterium]|nr:inositol 2-dehydrogenase [Gammaproteobacteria bacterium]
MSIRIALLGAGRIGQVHAKAIAFSRGAQLAAVADAYPEAAQRIADQYGCQTSTVEALIASAEIDAVLIATSTDTHADLIEAAARAGKAIFCEKPIDLDVERVRRCIEVVAQTGAKLMIGFNRRFDPHFKSAQQAIAGGCIGAVEQVQITSRDPAPPPIDYIKRSGGIFRDMMIHDFDMARFMLGEEPVSVMATGSVLVDSEIGAAGDYDTAMAILTTDSGKQCVITNSRRATYGYDQRLEVHGANGMVSADNPRITGVEIAAESGYSRGPLHNFFMTRYTEAYQAEIETFVQWLGGADIEVPSGQDGLRAIELAEAALKSAQTGQTVKV